MKWALRTIVVLAASSASALAAEPFNILSYGAPGKVVDRTGHEDASPALAAAILAANVLTAQGQPACVYIPAGTYRLMTPPPAFARAGCVKGDGPTQSTIKVDRTFEGDVFAWSEAWMPTTPGPTAVGLRIEGDPLASARQNGLVFYDRNDEVFLDNVEIDDLHGRGLYAGVRKSEPQAYMREAHMRSLRFFRDGAPGVPVVEFSSEGTGRTDATNEISISQLDIYGERGPGLVIRNNGSGAVRSITIDCLRIEGLEAGTSEGDLLTIGDRVMSGRVDNIRLTNVELQDAASAFAALRMTAAPGAEIPYQIRFEGAIGGGIPRGFGLYLEAGRTSTFRLSGIHSLRTNVVVGPRISGIVLDGGGQEQQWSYDVDPSAARGILTPVLTRLAIRNHKP